MSTTTVSKKRKSADGNATTSKKVKITKSADKPAPLKSALKKSTSTTVAEAPAQNGVVSKKTTKKTVAAPVEEGDDAQDFTPDQTAALLAGFSSDSESEREEEDGVALSSIPKAPKAAKTAKQIKEAGEEDPETTPGVLYIGRIPHGFYEPQMRAYFSQFGSISHLRLARNKKTGKSQHYAFVEFESAAVAEIVRKTMDKYLLFGHILQVRSVPREQVRENMFAGSGRRARRKVPRNRIEGRKLAKGTDREGWGKRISREEGRRAEKAAKLAEMGYQFEMPELRGVEDVPVKVKGVEGVDFGAGADAEEDERVQVVTEKAEDGGEVVTVEEVTKKRPAHGKTEAKKKVKKMKT